MVWHRITIPGNDATQGAATALIEELEAAHAAAEKPACAEVFHRRRGDGSHEFFLSPLASQVASLVVLRHSAEECDEPSGQDRLVRVHL